MIILLFYIFWWKSFIFNDLTVSSGPKVSENPLFWPIFINFGPIWGPLYPLYVSKFNLFVMFYSNDIINCIFWYKSLIIIYSIISSELKCKKNPQFWPNFVHFSPIWGPVYPLNGTQFNFISFLHLNNIIMLCFLIKIIHI